MALDWNPCRMTEDMSRLTTLLCSRTVWSVAILCLVMGTGVGELLAQAPAPPPSGGGSSTVIVQGRGLGFEWVLTIAMCGAALFVVCRSSRRN